MALPAPGGAVLTRPPLRLATLAAIALAWSAAARAAPACPAEVRVGLPNFEIAPYVLGTDKVESPPGLLVEWTRNALMLAGCDARIVIKRRPPARQLSELDMGLIDVLPGFAFSASTADQLLFPMKNGEGDPARAIMSDTVSLYARAADQSVQWDGKTLRSSNPLVGSSIGGASPERLTSENGWRIENAPTPETDLRKLLAGRIDVIVEPDVVMRPLLAGPNAPAVRKLTPPALTTHRYAPVSVRFGAAYPEFTARFWLELCRQARGARACE